MKAKFNKLDRSKLSKEVNSILDKIKNATDNFKKEDKKAEALFDRLYDKIKEGKPEAIKSTKKPSKSKKKKTSGGSRGVFTKLAKSIRDAKPSLTWKQAMAEASKKLKADKEKANKKFSSSIQTLIDANKSYFGSAKASSLEKDAKQPAKPIGKRRSKKGKTYYEYRTNRTDVKQPPKSFPMLEKGGNVEFRRLAKGKNFDIITDEGRYEIEMGAFGMPKNIIVDGTRKDINTNPIAKKYRAEIQDYLDANYEKGGLTKDEKLQAKISADDFMGQFRKTKNIVLRNFGEKTFKEFDRIVRNKLSSGKNYEQGGVVDLFENYETLPTKVKDTIDFYMEKYQDGDYDYEDSKRFLKDMEMQGYTFEYGLDNEPYDLRKMEKGGKIGFEGLAKKVAKNYEGKKVKPKFQSEYGKTYDKEEAMQVGRAVAGKVLKQQNMKKMEDGGIVRDEGVAYQGGMSYGTTENIAPQFEDGGNVNRGFFNVEIIMKDGSATDILPFDVSEEEAQHIANKVNNMKPMSARAEVPLFAKGGMTTKMYYIVYNEANGEKSYAEVPATSEKEAIEKLKKEGGVERIVRVRKMDKDEYAKGGKVKAKKEIAEGLEELEVGLAGASKKHKQQSKLAKQIKDGFESSFKKGGNVPKRFLDEKGERKNDPETIEELTKYVMSLPQTKSKHFNKVTEKYSPKRQKLHRQIINKFKGDLVCIESDEPIAILMGGSPASGKSTFLRKYAPYLLKEELLRIDADEVRAMLPEYKGWNASATHNETQDIVKTLLSDRTIGVPCKYDVIFDGTMTSPKKYLDLIRLLKKLGYKVFVVFIDKVPKDVIMKRAMDRYKKSGRFVPPFVIEEFFESGKDSLAKVKAKVDGYMIVDGSDSNYRVAEQKGLKLPKTRKYSRLGVPLKKRVTRKKK